MSTTPPTPPSPEDSELPPDGDEGGSNTAMIVVGSVAAVLVIAAIVVGVGLLLSGDDDGDGGSTAAGEVFLEPAASAGPDPFTTDVDTDAPDPDDLAVPAATPTDSGGDTNAVRGESGDAVGLYGGTLDSGSCDRDQLVAFLESNPDKAQAWVDALNKDSSLRWSGGTTLTTADIATYVDELTPIVLVTDTRVTNYGFANGAPTGRQAVLQRGTAVLVDQYGVPRTKCNCGNPLTKPTAVTGSVSYTGTEWSDFDATTIIVVQETTVIVNTFVLVDVNQGGTFERPSGTTGSDDVDIDVGGGTTGTPPDTDDTDTTTRTGATNYCEALQFYVDQASAIDVFDDSPQAEADFIAFLDDAVNDLADLAPDEVKGDWEWFRDVILPQLVAGNFEFDDGTGEERDARIEAHASAECGIALNE